MALKSVLFTENGAAQNADEVRLMLAGLLGGQSGYLSGVPRAGDFAASEKAGTPDMSVSVAAGHLFIAGSRSAAQGVYHVYNDATASVVIPAAHPTLPRIDIVYVRVRDSAYDVAFSGLDDAVFAVAQGTPAASPVAPTISADDHYPICRVAVAASETAIETSHITDLRGRLRPWHTPWGRLAAVQLTASSTPVTSTSDVAGFAVTFTEVEGRTYEARLQCGFDGTSASHFAWIRRGATYLQSHNQISAAGTHLIHYQWTAAATGPVTIQAAVQPTGGNNTRVVAAATNPAQLAVYDTGPA
jgi:hypothetical protein